MSHQRTFASETKIKMLILAKKELIKYFLILFLPLNLICCAPSIHSVNPSKYDFKKSNLPIVYGRIKFEGEKDGNFLVRRNIVGFVNIINNEWIGQAGYFKPDDSGYFVHQVNPGKIRIYVFDEKIVFSPIFGGSRSIERNYYYKNSLDEIDLKPSSVNYIGNITLKSGSRVIEASDVKNDVDGWVLSKSRLFDSDVTIKNIPKN